MVIAFKATLNGSFPARYGDIIRKTRQAQAARQISYRPASIAGRMLNIRATVGCNCVSTKPDQKYGSDVSALKEVCKSLLPRIKCIHFVI